MLRNVALILLPVALLAAACGGGSSDGDDPVANIGPAGPDGIYNTVDDNVGDESLVGDLFDFGDEPDAPDGLTDDGVEDDSLIDSTIPGDSDDSVVVDSRGGSEIVSGSLDDNALLGAINPFSFLGGEIPVPFGLGSIDLELGVALLTLADVPSSYQELGEFSISAPSEVGEMDMAVRIFGTSDDPDDFGAMIMSMALILPPEAMSELDELTGLTEADLAEMEAAAGEFGTGLVDFQILDADSLGADGFGIHMEIDFGALLSAFGAQEDDSMPTGIAMDIFGFAAGERVLLVMTMWPTGESSGADALALAQIMAGRA